MRRRLLRDQAQQSPQVTAVLCGGAVGLLSNLANNLPTGLIAGTAVQAAGAPPGVAGAILIGVDVGPNLSVTGSLATILWLAAFRREGLEARARDFLKWGLVIMPPALALSLAALLLQ